MTLPGRTPAITPRSPSTTSSTSCSSQTQIPTTSDPAASSAGDSATVAAVPSKGTSELSRLAHNVVATPASSIRVTILAPILPRPMKPTRNGEDTLSQSPSGMCRAPVLTHPDIERRQGRELLVAGESAPRSSRPMPYLGTDCSRYSPYSQDG